MMVGRRRRGAMMVGRRRRGAVVRARRHHDRLDDGRLRHDNRRLRNHHGGLLDDGRWRDDGGLDNGGLDDRRLRNHHGGLLDDGRWRDDGGLDDGGCWRDDGGRGLECVDDVGYGVDDVQRGVQILMPRPGRTMVVRARLKGGAAQDGQERDQGECVSCCPHAIPPWSLWSGAPPRRRAHMALFMAMVLSFAQPIVERSATFQSGGDFSCLSSDWTQAGLTSFCHDVKLFPVQPEIKSGETASPWQPASDKCKAGARQGRGLPF